MVLNTEKSLEKYFTFSFTFWVSSWSFARSFALDAYKHEIQIEMSWRALLKKRILTRDA